MYSYAYSYPYASYWVSDIPYYSQAFVNVQQPQTVPTTNLDMNPPKAIVEKTKRPTTNDKPQPTIFPIRIVDFDSKIETRSTTIDEKSAAVLKYRTPHFRASATLKFPPLDEGEHWKIGWIQACTRMDFFNCYGESGYSSWEFPQLMSGQNSMISDSDGRNYPFYGSKCEVIELHGPSDDYQTVKVLMNDNFYPHITWDIPTSNERLARLTYVKRHQSFYTWLVAMNVRTGSILVLKTIKWQMNLEISVEPTKAQGSRATLISDPMPIQPEILKQNIRIPLCVLHPPNANSAQILVWHPACRLGEMSTRPEIVVPPRCTSVLHQNPFYDHYIRHKTHTSVQNKLNGESSASENKTRGSSSKPYSRVIYPPNCSTTTSAANRCYNEVKQMLENHAKIAQTVTVR